MKETRAALVFAMVLVSLVALLANVFGAQPGRRHWELFTEMVYSKAQESNTPDADFPSGTSQQALLPGVVPRGLLPLRFEATAEEAQRAGAVLRAPAVEDGRVADRRGAELYRIYCSVCHDLGGGGHGPVVLRGMIPPPSLLAAHATQMADGQLFHLLTYGQGNMASYAAQLTRAERWLVVRHLRAMQGVQR